MYIKKDDYEWKILHAFKRGMGVGYGIELTKVTEEENEAIIEFAEHMGFKRKTLEVSNTK